MEGNDKVDEVIIDPSVQQPTIQVNTFRPQATANPTFHPQQEPALIHPALDTSKPLQETMLPK